jgi:2-dehydro-3-deoxy-D-gluconate 5-dehydrogenase
MSSSLFSLQGKTAILTGATRGIGKGIAIGLAQAGADIILLQVFERSSSSALTDTARWV